MDSINTHTHNASTNTNAHSTGAHVGTQEHTHTITPKSLDKASQNGAIAFKSHLYSSGPILYAGSLMLDAQKRDKPIIWVMEMPSKKIIGTWKSSLRCRQDLADFMAIAFARKLAETTGHRIVLSMNTTALRWFFDGRCNSMPPKEWPIHGMIVEVEKFVKQSMGSDKIIGLWNKSLLGVGPIVKIKIKERIESNPVIAHLFHQPALYIDPHDRIQSKLSFKRVYPDKADGTCACGCGQPIGNRKRKWATDDCQEQAETHYAIIRGTSKVIRKEVFKRDGGICRHCGQFSNDWDADHIIPVRAGGSACGMDNFQTLCVPCHRIKNASDREKYGSYKTGKAHPKMQLAVAKKIQDNLVRPA